MPIAGVLRDELTAYAALTGSREGLGVPPPGRAPVLGGRRLAPGARRVGEGEAGAARADRAALLPTHLRELAYRGGVNPKKVASYMGHADVSTTLNVYAKLFEAHEAETLEKLDELLTRHDTAARLASLNS